MKDIFITDILTSIEPNTETELYGWVKSKRTQKNVVFIDVTDSTGMIQTVVLPDMCTQETYDLVKGIAVETAIKVTGTVVQGTNQREIIVKSLEVIGQSTHTLNPSPRSNIDIFDTRLADHLLKNRHFYIRNPKTMAILKFRHLITGAVHQWFRENRFIEITAPVLTPLPLYDDQTALSLEIHGQKVFLTQCVGYYLESSVHAFERVYNLGPSFRGEESRSKRHLMEYWHIKAEMAFGNRDDVMRTVEELLVYIVKFCQNDEVAEIFHTLGTTLSTDALQVPYPRITYREALEKLRSAGKEITFGQSMGSEEEEWLSQHFEGPFWIVGVPRSIEPFPYVIDPSDPELTMTADLISSNGYGELLGVAEKISDLEMLRERMAEKGKLGQPAYNWLLELREMGCVPHIGFGMGLERLIRWLLQIPHVRDAMPFPRSFRRNIYP